MRRLGKQTDLASALGALARGFDRKSKGQYLQVQAGAAWEKVAGPAVAAHTTNEHMRNGELVVFVDSPVWATELSALAGPYRDALNEELGRKAVRSVRFAVSRKVENQHRITADEHATEEFYLPDPTEPVPLSDVERAQVEASAEGIPDERLREAVIRATVAGMEWRKGQHGVKTRQKPREGL